MSKCCRKIDCRCDDEHPRELKCGENDGVLARKLLKWILASGTIALGAAALVNAIIALRTPPLNRSLPGVFNRYPWRQGDLAYTVSGNGEPLLLIHDPYVGNSSEEWEDVVGLLSLSRTVYAFDFLGWGLSDQPPQTYTADDLSEQVCCFIRDVIQSPAAVVATGGSCPIVLNATSRNKELFSHLTLVDAGQQSQPPDKGDRVSQLAGQFFIVPVLGRAVYNYLVSRRNIHRLLPGGKQDGINGDYKEDKHANHRYAATHQPGSSWALATVLSGGLHCEWMKSWADLEMPALLIWGRDNASSGDVPVTEWLAIKADADLVFIDGTGSAPHLKKPREFAAALLQWLGDS